MTTRTTRPRPRPARGLVASLSVAALALTGMIASPAAAAKPDKLDKLELASAFDRARVRPENLKVAPSLREASGEVTAFVKLKAQSGAELDRAGRSRSQVRAQEKKIEALADEVVPLDASPRTRDRRPRKLAVTTNLVAGVVVVGDAEEVRELAAENEVEAVYRIIHKTPSNKGTDAFTRALNTWQSTGYTGKGVRVGIIDTGIDYTHASFGGPGTLEAYQEAYGSNGTGPVPPGTFDATKFKGGYDFAGPTYGTTSSVPTPDENPIDNVHSSPNSGHGTHVAGTTAGYGVTAEGETFRGDYGSLTTEDVADFLVGPGSAPEAELYALKVFGDGGGSTGLVIQALEWAADPDDDGDFNDRLDILNLSLGSDGSPADDPENLFIDALTKLGVLSVIASGNGGDVHDVGGSPGNANSALTVANSVGGTQSFDAIEVTQAPDDALVGTWAAQNSVNYAGEDDATAEVAAAPANPDSDNPFHSGCTPFTPEQAAAVAGKIAYLYWNDQDPTLECGSGVRFTNAQAAGAVGVLLSSQVDVFSAGIAGNATLPGAQLTGGATRALQDAILAGGVVVHLGPSLANAGFEANGATADLVNDGSSRGVHGSLGLVKPDVAAPGTNISSAASGTGTGPSILTGTSMATPHVAGIAALVAEAHPDWTPVQVKQAVMNTATNDLFRDSGQSGPVWGPERVGSGRVDALDAVSTSTLAWATQNPEGVSLTFGVVEVADSTVTLQETVTVRNLSNLQVTYDLSYLAASENPGASFSVQPATLTVRPGRTGLVTVRLTIDRDELARLTEPAQSGTANWIGEMPRDFVSNVSGWLQVTPRGDEALRVPVHAAPKPVSELATDATLDLSTADSADLALHGRGVVQDGWVSLLAPHELVAESPRLEDSASQGTSASVIASGDLRYVGFASDVPAILAGGGTLEDAIISVGIATQGNWASLGWAMIPLLATDIDGDGAWDLETAVFRPDDSQDHLWAITFEVTGEDPASGLLEWGDPLDVYPVGWGTDVEFGIFDSNVLSIPLSPGWVGIPEGATPTFRVQTYSPYALEGDVIDEVTFTADPFTPSYVFDGLWGTPTHLIADEGLPVTVQRTEKTPEQGKLLLLHTLNATGARAQVVEVTATPVEEPQEPVPPTASRTTLRLKPGRSVYGQKVSAEVTVHAKGVVPTGTVTISEGERVLAEAPVVAKGRHGTAKLALPADLAVGTHTLTASYSGSETVAPSSATARLKVAKVPTKVRLTTTSRTVTKNARPVLKVEVKSTRSSAPATGKVTVKVGKETLSATLTKGRAQLTLPKVTGTTKVTVTYPGSATHAKSRASITFTLQKDKKDKKADTKQKGTKEEKKRGKP